MRRLAGILILCACLGPVIALRAQAPALDPAVSPPEEEVEILVEGQAKPKRASVAQFREAQQAFRKFRPTLAPAAGLAFEIVSSAKSGVTAANIGSVRMALVSNLERIPVPIDAEHRFTLPDLSALKGDYKLLANVGKKPLYIAPRVFSPGTTRLDRRLGDMRLECQTGWAYYKSEVPIFIRAGFGLVGGCGSKRIGIYYYAQQPIASVTVTDAGKTTPLALLASRPNSFRPPIYDKKLSANARVKIVLK